MKKVWSCLLVLTMAFALAACGKDSEKTSGGDVSVTKGGKGVAIEDVTVDNWQQVVKDNFGLTLTLPEGWTVTKTVSLVGVHVYFGCNADEAEVVSFLEGRFQRAEKNRYRRHYRPLRRCPIQQHCGSPCRNVSCGRLQPAGERRRLKEDTFQLWQGNGIRCRNGEVLYRGREHLLVSKR